MKRKPPKTRTCASFALLLLLPPGCFLLPDTPPDGDTDGDTDGHPPDPPPDPNAFHHRAFIYQAQLYTGKINQSTIPGYPSACISNDVLDDATTLDLALKSDAWDVRFARDPYLNSANNILSEPSQVFESHNSPYFPAGGDSTNADAYDLFFYTGHGNPGGLFFNQLRVDGAGCGSELQNDVRLGAFCGQEARVAIYSASCVAAIDQDLCGLVDDADLDGIGDAPWPFYCWDALRCTLLQGKSRSHLTFMDTPVVSAGDIQAWYPWAKNTLHTAWMLGLRNSKYDGSKNQPLVNATAPTHAGLQVALFQSGLDDGIHLDKVHPDSPLTNVTAFVEYTGETVYLDGEEPLQAWDSPDDYDACRLDHQVACDDINPETSWADCQ